MAGGQTTNKEDDLLLDSLLLSIMSFIASFGILSACLYVGFWWGLVAAPIPIITGYLWYRFMKFLSEDIEEPESDDIIIIEDELGE